MVMRERERIRERDNYEQIIKYLNEDRKRSFTGDVDYSVTALRLFTFSRPRLIAGCSARS